MTIAGFDPSGGAGILADIKTFEAHKCLGFAVQTANTIQTEDRFVEVNWILDDQILKQLKELQAQYQFDMVKIGLIPSLTVLDRVIDQLRSVHSKVQIIWDPVLAVSAGFDFEHDLSSIEQVLGKIDFLTPNWNEMARICPSKNQMDGAREFSKYCKIYLKGGHNSEKLGTDFLMEDGKLKGFNPKMGSYSPKHGSGCVFSAALASNLLKGYPLQKAILKSKRYIEKVLKSNVTPLGYHYG